MKKKLIEWWKRYSLPVFLGTITAIIIANIVKYFFDNIILAGILGAWSDFIVGYGTIAYRDIKDKRKVTFINIIKVLRNMLFEFGPAEFLDTFFFRPFFMSVYPLFIANYSLAVLLGSLTAEITYFIPTIISYEIRKKVIK